MRLNELINNPLIPHPSITLEAVERKLNKRINVYAKILINKKIKQKEKFVLLVVQDNKIYFFI